MRSCREWWLVARAAAVMTAFALARALPPAAWRRFSSGFGRTPSGARGSAVLPAHVVRAVNTASRIVPGGANCLVRALTGRALLARQGKTSEIVYGVARGPAGTLRAHAWLRCQGQLLLGVVGTTGFVPMPDRGRPDPRGSGHALSRS